MSLTASPPHCEFLKEESQVLAQQHILVEQDLAARDLPAALDVAQQVLALADQDVGLGLHPVAVDQKAASHRDLGELRCRRVDLEEVDVGNQMRDAGDRLLSPMNA